MSIASSTALCFELMKQYFNDSQILSKNGMRHHKGPSLIQEKIQQVAAQSLVSKGDKFYK